MNIDGHEVERREARGRGRVYIDGRETDYAGTGAPPQYYESDAAAARSRARRDIESAEDADLIAEFVRREAAEKAAADTALLAARIDIERRAKILVRKLSPHVGWDFLQESSRRQFRDAIRALDADAAEREA